MSNSAAGYKFKEVRCPSCGHVFTWLEMPPGNSYCVYRRKGVDEELFSTVCPQCNLEIVVPDGSHEGISIEDSNIELCGTMRGI